VIKINVKMGYIIKGNPCRYFGCSNCFGWLTLTCVQMHEQKAEPQIIKVTEIKTRVESNILIPHDIPQFCSLCLLGITVQEYIF
jgi:hypothetical protein